MSVYTIQPSFSGGEFSPSLYSRVDVAKYSTGLKKLKNFIIHPHGGVSNRGGLQFVAKAKVSAKKVRVIPFEYSIEQAYVLEFNEGYIRFIIDGGLVLASGGASVYQVAIPYTENDLVDIKFTQSVDVLYLFHPNYTPKRLTRYASNNWVLDDFPFEKGPFLNDKQTSSLTVLPTGSSATLGLMLAAYPIKVTTGSAYFTANHIGSLVKINQFVQGASISSTFSGTGTSTALVVKGTWRLATRGTWAGVITVKRSTPGSYSAYEVIKTFSHNSVDYNIDAFGTEDDICRMAIEVTTLTSGTINIDLSCDSFTQDGVVRLDSYVSSTRMDGVIVNPVLEYTSILSWQEGAWSIARGFPSCGAFFQDRLAMAATPYEPQTTWFSQTGNYVNFGTNSPLQDTDAVTVNLPSRKMNGIKNMVSLAEILTFTSASECGIGDSGGVFTPTTVKTKVHGYRGSNKADPVIIGNRAIAVQAMGAVVRDYGYDYASDSFTGTDLSIFSTHLFQGLSITEMAYQQEPDSLVWCVRSDGKALSMTYMKEQEVTAWSWHETDGLFESVCSIPGDGQNDVYFVVNRNGVRNIERLTNRLPIIDSEEAVFLDSSLTYRGTATTTISGLTHLEGKTVNVLANGRVVKGLVVTSGVIHLPIAATIVHVGLPYVADFQTLNIQVPMQDGTGFGRLVKVAETRFTFLNSRGGFIGPDKDNLDEVIDLAGVILSDPKELFSGEYKQSMASGYEAGGAVFFRQSDPLPVTILSVMPRLTIGG